jgi:hypothetical protein
MVRTCTGAVATRFQVQMQPCQHGPKSAIRHDISPCLQCTLRNRKYCVLQVRLSGAEPVHRGRGQIPLSRCGVRELRSSIQASQIHSRIQHEPPICRCDCRSTKLLLSASSDAPKNAARIARWCSQVDVVSRTAKLIISRPRARKVYADFHALPSES